MSDLIGQLQARGLLRRPRRDHVRLMTTARILALVETSTPRSTLGGALRRELLRRRILARKP